MRIRFHSNTSDILYHEQSVLRRLELSTIRRQIEVLASFLPNEILKLHSDESFPPQNFVGAVLTISVEGFTILADKYNKISDSTISHLTAELNAYVGSIVETIMFYKGDVLKMSGFSFIAVWKLVSENSLFELLHEAIICATVIKARLSDYVTISGSKLSMKFVVTCGNMAFSVIGPENRLTYLLVGEAIADVYYAGRIQHEGDIVVSAGAWSHMLQERYEIVPLENEFVKVINIVYKPNEGNKKIHYEELQIEVLHLIDLHMNHKEKLLQIRTLQSNITDDRILDPFIRSLPPRLEVKHAPRFWAVNQLRPFMLKNILNQIDESQPVEYLTEHKDLTIQFIYMRVGTSVSDLNVIDVTNRAYKMISFINERALGAVNKLCAFDDNVLVISVFGSRGVAHELESQNALKSAYKIKTELVRWKEVESSSASVCKGLMYLGVVGHPMRREYQVLGTAAKIARTLIKLFPDKVTCDFRTFNNCKLSSFYFKRISEQKLTPYIDIDLTIFEYEESKDYVPKDYSYSLIGRKSEFNMVQTIIHNPEFSGGYCGVSIYGITKIGKTAIFRAALASAMQSSCTIASVELQPNLSTPYYCIISVYKQLYDNLADINQKGIMLISRIPRDLRLMIKDMHYKIQDFALQKYRILNCFRDITRMAECIIFIDNFQHIDKLSWEIIEIALSDGNIRIVISGCFEETESWDMQFQLSINDAIKMLELRPIKNKDIPSLACQFLEVAAIPKALITHLIKSCDGCPGKVQVFLLYLINIGCLDVKLVRRKDAQELVFPLTKYSKSRSLVPVVFMSEKYKSMKKRVTLAAISLDLFDSFEPFPQLVIKTASALGNVFSRSLLTVALKCPAEAVLSEALAELFRKEILECGSRYVDGNKVDLNKLCCKCNFEAYGDDINPDSKLPTYAYCKLIHFKNSSIKSVAYDLLSSNHKRELHLLCTDFLENIDHQCPACLRDKSKNFFFTCKFKEVMDHCNYGDKIKMVTLPHGSSLKETIRTSIVKRRSTVQIEHVTDVNKIRNNVDCRCPEMAATIHMDLIYHSDMADNLEKRIFFMTQYGIILIHMFDYTQAIKVLTDARNWCMNMTQQCIVVTEIFRKLHLGKIETNLAKIHLELHNLKQARAHLAIALRQYNIPSVAIHYKVFSCFIIRRSLVRISRRRPILYRNTLYRSDMSTCLGYCAKLFSMEGHFKLAKAVCNHSIYLMQTVNMNTTLLFDYLCDAINIYRYCYDMHTCNKLQRFALKEIQVNYANNHTEKLFSILNILNMHFLHIFSLGNICSAIRFGYRIVDINTKVNAYATNLKTIPLFSLLLMYNSRMNDSIDICRLLKHIHLYYPENMVTYYCTCLIFQLLTAFVVKPMDEIANFAKNRIENSASKEFSWEEHLFFFKLQIHFLKQGNYQRAIEFQQPCEFKPNIIKTIVPLRAILSYIEIKIYWFLREKRLRGPYTGVQERAIFCFFKMAKRTVIEIYPVLLPEYWTLKAWFMKVLKKNWTSKRLLKKVSKLSIKQNNILYQCFVCQLENYWSGGFSFKYSTRPKINYKVSRTFTFKEWAQFMNPYPLE